VNRTHSWHCSVCWHHLNDDGLWRRRRQKHGDGFARRQVHVLKPALHRSTHRVTGVKHRCGRMHLTCCRHWAHGFYTSNVWLCMSRRSAQQTNRYNASITHAHTYTPVQCLLSRLAGCPWNFFLRLFRAVASSRHRPKLFTWSLMSIHHVFLMHLCCLAPSTSIIMPPYGSMGGYFV